MLKLVLILFVLNSSLYAKVDKESRQIVKKLALLMVDKSVIESQEKAIKAQIIDRVMIRYSKQNRVAFMSESSKSINEYLKFEKKLKSGLQSSLKKEISLYSFSLKMYSSVYLKYFNKKDLKILLSFYQSSTGKKFVKVNSNVMNGVQTRLNKHLKTSISSLSTKLSTIVKKETKEFLATIEKK
ncbi:MAG: DUF2059 domain-containing protein [Candidatus Cloacimonetes bacterium]|nr:DUF2059 domain-containing protein [Candidatus Cloacimonadota bacterium]